MLNLIGAGAGVMLGAALAWRRGGNWMDMAQYGAVFALIGLLAGTIAMLVIPAPI